MFAWRMWLESENALLLWNWASKQWIKTGLNIKCNWLPQMLTFQLLSCWTPKSMNLNLFELKIELTKTQPWHRKQICSIMFGWITLKSRSRIDWSLPQMLQYACIVFSSSSLKRYSEQRFSKTMLLSGPSFFGFSMIWEAEGRFSKAEAFGLAAATLALGAMAQWTWNWHLWTRQNPLNLKERSYDANKTNFLVQIEIKADWNKCVQIETSNDQSAKFNQNTLTSST